MGFLRSSRAQLSGLLAATVSLGGGCSHPASPTTITKPIFGAPILIIADGGLSGSSNISMVVGDLNGDDVPDLVESRSSTYNTVSSSIFLGLADGGLIEPRPFGQSTSAAVFDPDGGAALASIDGTNRLALSSADGSPLAHYPMSTFAFGFSVADLNLDGKPDLALCAAEGTGVEVLWNLGGGKFRDPAVLNPGRAIAAYAGTGTSLPSLAVASACGGQLEILPNLTPVLRE
jgi:hypothetical protein